jgi:hypothetical protein
VYNKDEITPVDVNVFKNSEGNIEDDEVTKELGLPVDKELYNLEEVGETSGLCTDVTDDDKKLRFVSDFQVDDWYGENKSCVVVVIVCVKDETESFRESILAKLDMGVFRMLVVDDRRSIGDSNVD